MARLSQIVYEISREPRPTSAGVDRMFEGLSEPVRFLPSMEELGVEVPEGSMRAVRYKGEVILMVREQNKQGLTITLQNLLVDLGIGTTADREDLRKVFVIWLEFKRAWPRSLRYGCTNSLQVLDNRAEGDTPLARFTDGGQMVACEAGQGAKYGAFAGGVLGLPLAIFLAPASGGTSLLAWLGMAAAGATAGSATAASVQVAKSLHAEGASAYSRRTQEYIACGLNYIDALYAASSVHPGDEVVAVGHSLGGYLAQVFGAVVPHYD